MKKKLLAVVLALCLVLSMVPVALALSADVTTIEDVQDLQDFAASVNTGNDYEGKTVTLAANLDLTGVKWTPIGDGTRSGSGYDGDSFKGTFDGGNHIISGLTITTTTGADAALGLFGVVDGGTVKDLTLEDVNINVSESEVAGGAIGVLTGGGIADNITVSGSVSAKRGNGGIVGRMLLSGTISNCVNNAAMSATGGANLGGIAGAAYYTAEGKSMTIKNCVNNGTMTGSAGGVGGIVGLSAAHVSNCTNNAAVKGNGASVGGIVGEQQNYGSVVDCTNIADVTNTANYGTGGIVGWSRYNGAAADYPLKGVIEIKDNINNGTVSGGNDAGGIVGVVYNAAIVSGNENTAASLTASGFAAGIVANVQFTETPIQGTSPDREIIPQQTVNLSNNVSTTAIDKITASNKNLYAYDNTSGSQDGKIEDNAAAWVAQVGDDKYTTLQAAIKAVQNGGTVTLMTDVVLSKELEETREISYILDGDGHTISGVGIRIINADCTMTNIVFEGCTGGGGTNDGIVEFVNSKSSVVDCVFENNTCSRCIDVDSSVDKGTGTSEVVISGCIFRGNVCSKIGVIGVLDGESTVIEDCGFIRNSADSNIIYIGDNASVTGCYFNDNTIIGDASNKATIVAGPYSAGTYTIAITGNAFTDADCSIWLEDWETAYNAISTYDIGGNYWADGKEPVEGTNYGVTNAPEIINTSYMTGYSVDADGKTLVLSGERTGEEVTVTFLAGEGTGTMDAVMILPGDYTLPAPEFDAPANHGFKGWQIGDALYAAGTVVSITEDTNITAIYAANEYTVIYKADGVIVDTVTVEYGKDAVAPTVPAKVGYTGAWAQDGKNITADTVIEAVYTINTYTVTYKADGQVVATVTVEYGKDAVAPTVPAKEGYNGVWDQDGKNIIADTVITAVYTVIPPKTGDAFSPVLLLAMITVSIFAVAGIVVVSRKIKTNSEN